MSNSEITHVSDTALLVAACRAIESERPDAFFHDPFARRLAGERGFAMCRSRSHPEIMEFGLAIRTRMIDELLLETIRSAGVKTVLCPGSGLDTRPWRLDLPSELRWIEVDFADMLGYKESLMAGEKPRCRRERLAADVNDPAQRQSIYAAASAAPALILSEGLLMYLPAGSVQSLVAETFRNASIAHWIIEATTSAFTNALGGDSARGVGHVQAIDHLKGEQILETFHSHGWKTAAHRSFITDLAFAKERIAAMMRNQPVPPKPPPFPPGDPTGIHLFGRV